MRTAVIGAGVMGAGIAELFASHGHEVTLIDVIPAALSAAKERISRHDAKLASIVFSADIASAKAAEVVIEAVVESLDVKRKVFQELDRLNPSAILASNTSTIRIADIAAACKRKERILGLHFYNPPQKMELVEIVRTEETNEESYRRAAELCKSLGKTPVTVKDEYGFVGNRGLMPLINEAVWMLHEGIATKEDIDRVFTLGMRHPMGPLALADFIGLDTCVAIMEQLQRGLKQEKFRPCPLLAKLVKEGKLGRKSGEGFFRYEKSI